MPKDTAVEKLLLDFNSTLKKAREIYSTLQTLKNYGADFDLPNTGDIFDAKQALSDSVKKKIRPDEFYGSSQTEAAEKFLLKIGHATLLGDIYDALSEGGIAFGKKDGIKNLYTQLIRANRKFVKIGSGQNASFGLIAWYPKKKNRSEEMLKKLEDAKGVGSKKPNAKKVLIKRKEKPAEQAGNSSNEEENKL